jgi:hypothetical protein
MKKTLITLSLACTTLLPGASFADNLKSMLGTWTGIANVAVIGNAEKHHKPPEGKGVRFTKTELTLKIEVEEGRNFSGSKISKTHTETIAGSFMSDMVNGFIVDSDGIASFKRVGNDVIEHCYAHVPNAQSNSSVVGCTEFKRQ